jgi:hypothetical protein
MLYELFLINVLILALSVIPCFVKDRRKGGSSEA